MFYISLHIAGEQHKLWAAQKPDSKTDVKPVLAAFEENSTSTWYVEGITRQGLQKLQSHSSPCDAESPDGNKRARMRQQDPLIQHLTAPLFPLSSKFHISIHMPQLCRNHMEGQACFSSHVQFCFWDSRVSKNVVHFKRLAWRRNRWK